MDYFENIIKTLLESEGWWVRQSFKVNLTKEEKRTIGKHSIPRPEIDLLAYKPGYIEILVLEVKSFLDSPGIRLSELSDEQEIPSGRYKLFTCRKYREIVFRRLKKDLVAAGMLSDNAEIKLGLVAGKIYQRRSEEVRATFLSKGWFFWSPEDVRERVQSLALMSYENEPAIITAKILMR